MMFIHFWGIIFAFILHLLLHLLKYFFELGGIVLSLRAQWHSLCSCKLVFQTLPLITLLDKWIDVAAVTVENVWVETAIATHLRIDLVHNFLALFQTHIYHELLNCYELTLIEWSPQLVHNTIFAIAGRALVQTISLILFVFRCFCTLSGTSSLLLFYSVFCCLRLMVQLGGF